MPVKNRLRPKLWRFAATGAAMPGPIWPQQPAELSGAM